MTSHPAARTPTQAPLAHGGNLAAARLMFPGAREPLVDLSTGINPHPYRMPDLPPATFTRLPEPESLLQLQAVAAIRYRATSAGNVVAAPGTQILLPLIASLLPAGSARVLGPTYAEHLHAAKLAGHDAQEVASMAQMAGADVATIVNPNNPDGRITGRGPILRLVREAAERGGIVIVDEAFADVADDAMSVADETNNVGLIVLRSFGKFHGLAGIRLGFAICDARTAEWLRERLGPWAVSGAAIAVGKQALADDAWATDMRLRLAEDSARMDRLLAAHGLTVLGGTDLFRLARGPADLFQTLGQAGIIVRRFARRPGVFRFGLPDREREWTRLAAALP